MQSTMPAATVDRLCLPKSMRDTIMIHLIEATPNEGVGLLAVRPPYVADDDQNVAEATRFYPGTNIEASPSRFTMDPVEVVAAFRDIRESGWQLGAIVHSHLRGPATPSTTDLREAHYPDALLMIASFADQPAYVRAWRVTQEDDLHVVQSVEIVVLDDM